MNNDYINGIYVLISCSLTLCIGFSIVLSKCTEELHEPIRDLENLEDFQEIKNHYKAVKFGYNEKIEKEQHKLVEKIGKILELFKAINSIYIFREIAIMLSIVYFIFLGQFFLKFFFDINFVGMLFIFFTIMVLVFFIHAYFIPRYFIRKKLLLFLCIGSVVSIIMFNFSQENVFIIYFIIIFITTFLLYLISFFSNYKAIKKSYSSLLKENGDSIEKLNTDLKKVYEKLGYKKK